MTDEGEDMTDRFTSEDLPPLRTHCILAPSGLDRNTKLVKICNKYNTKKMVDIAPVFSDWTKYGV